MKHLALIFIVFASFNVYGQIPNAGFEEWSNVNGDLIPDGWKVKCCGADYVTRDTDHVQGDYSIRLFGNLFGIDAPAATWIKAKVNYSTPPNRLKFFCKCFLEEAATTGFCGLRVGHSQGAVFWYEEEGIDEFKEITVELDTLELQQNGKFYIDFYASLGWGWPPPFGSATMFIDSVFLEYTTGITNKSGPDFLTIVPNPFNQFLRVNNNTDLFTGRLVLQDVFGRIIVETHENILNTNDLPPGQYYLTVIDEKGGVKTKLVVKSP